MITPSKEFWEVFKKTPGALSCAEALAIMNIAAIAPEGICAEFGSYHGKSAMSAILKLNTGRFYLVDPIFEDEKIAEDVMDRVDSFVYPRRKARAFGDYSTEILKAEDFNSLFSYIFIDSGSHGDGLPMQEAKLLEDRLIQGGVIAWHDYKNQFVEVEGAYNYLVSTGKYEPVEINWQEIFDYVAEHNLEEGNNSWHKYPELPHPPNFIGALKRK